MMRTWLLVSLAAFGAFLIVSSCGDEKNTNPGIPQELIECMRDGGMNCMMDGGHMDGGMDGGHDGGMDGGHDGGLMGIRRTWVLKTEIGDEGLVGIDPDSDNEFVMPFTMMNNFGGIAGIAQGLVMSPDQSTLCVAYAYPAKLVVIDMAIRDVVKEIKIGDGGDYARDLVISRDGTAIYIANETTHKIFRFSTEVPDDGGSRYPITQTITAAELTGLSAPVGLALNPNGTVVIGSSAATQTKVLFADIADELTPRNAAVLNIAPSVKPTKCSWMRTRDEGYCVASGTAPDGGVGGSLWHFALAPDGGATTGTQVATLPQPAADIATSLDDRQLYVATGAGVSMYFLQPPPTAPLLVLNTPTGAGAFRLALTHDGGYLFVTNRTANTVTKLRATDLSIVKSYSNYASPAGVYVVP